MKTLLGASLLLATAACGAQEARQERSPGIERYPSARDLHALAEAYRAKHNLPALGVGVVHRGQIVGLGMAGERVAGTGDLADIDDVFDVASIAKSVAATIAAMLVEEGRLSWETTLVDALSDIMPSQIHVGFAGVTLELLLQHRAGLDHLLNRNERWRAWHRDRADLSPTQQRLAFTQMALRRAPRHTPRAAAHYTSDAYVIAGTILEHAAGMPWEQLVKTRLFDPLALTSMRYGPTGADGWTAPVLGHEPYWFGRSRAVPHDPDEYGPAPFGAPAGFLYGSIPDLLRWVDVHIQGANGRATLLQPASFRRLHSPADRQAFALGWESQMTRSASGQRLERSVYHGGYSGRSRANLWFVPETQWGTAIVTNSGRGDDDTITDEVFYALLREFGLLAATSE